MTERGASHPSGDTRPDAGRRWLEPLRRVLDVAQVATAILDGEGHIVAVNPAFTRLCGRGPSEVVGLHLLSLCPGRDQADVLSKLVRVVGGVAEVEQEQLRVTGADGRIRTLSVTLGAVEGADGRVERVLAVASDLTEERRSQRRNRSESVERAREQATDTTTGVPNARALPVLVESAIRRSARTDAPFALLRCEITGPSDSDVDVTTREVATTVAERLQQRLRSEDTITRSSPTAFTVIAEDLGDVQDAAGVAYRLLASVIEPVVIGTDHDLQVAMVVGIGVGDGTGHPDQLLADSEHAAAAARADGPGGFRIVDSRPAPVV